MRVVPTTLMGQSSAWALLKSAACSMNIIPIKNALRQLRSILYAKELDHRMAEQAKIEAGKKKIEWGSQIRSYVFDDRRVKDHRTNYQTSDVNGVMDGEIDDFIKAYLMEFSEKEEQ